MRTTFVSVTSLLLVVGCNMKAILLAPSGSLLKGDVTTLEEEVTEFRDDVTRKDVIWGDINFCHETLERRLIRLRE